MKKNLEGTTVHGHPVKDNHDLYEELGLESPDEKPKTVKTKKGPPKMMVEKLVDKHERGLIDKTVLEEFKEERKDSRGSSHKSEGSSKGYKKVESS